MKLFGNECCIYRVNPAYYRNIVHFSYAALMTGTVFSMYQQLMN